jgi:peptide/nickel transport system substrate-binding protein
MRHGIRRGLIVLAGVAAGAAAGPAVAQKSQDTLRLAATQPIQTLSYYLDPTPDTVFESDAVYDGPVAYDLKPGKVEPLLARSWQRIDPTTLEFELRDDVTWQDGAPFSAADVIATLHWLTDPKTMLRFKQNWAWIAKAEPLGPHRLRVTAKEPTPYDLVRFAYVTAILPAHQTGTPQDKGRQPIGTGPYRAVQVDQFKGIVLERSDGFRHGNPAKPGSKIARIVIKPIPEEGTRIAEFLAGNLDMIQASFEQARSLASDPRFAMTIVQGSSFMYAAFDAQGRSGAKPVTDERVRRALAMAIDRPALLRMLAGEARLEQPGAMCWRTQAGCDYSAPLPRFDPAAAKALLAMAGYPDGFDIEITTFIGPASEIAEAVAGQWRKIGVRAKIDRMPVLSYRKKQQEGRIQIMVAAWPAGNIPDVSGTVDAFFAAGPADYSGDKTLHDLAKASDAAIDPAARKAIGRKMFDRATEQVYFVPIAPFPTVLVRTKEVAVDAAGRFTPLGYDVSDIGWQ